MGDKGELQAICGLDVERGPHMKLILFNSSQRIEEVLEITKKRAGRFGEKYSPCVCFKDFVYHEIGHTLLNAQLYRLRRGIFNVSNINGIFKEHHHDIRLDVGEYARSDIKEFVAEAFVMKMKGTLPAYCRPMFREYGEEDE
jgi:hypothetical protein